ncbi:hypothetical protein NXY00_08220 [Bacteroides sp. BFG-551]|nr:hypothetical protein [Bacteroides sp. BFG-551]
MIYAFMAITIRDKCVWWEAVNEETGCADYHYTTLRQIIQEIDEDEELT